MACGGHSCRRGHNFNTSPTKAGDDRDDAQARVLQQLRYDKFLLCGCIRTCAPLGPQLRTWWQKGVPHSMQRAACVCRRSARASGATIAFTSFQSLRRSNSGLWGKEWMLNQRCWPDESDMSGWDKDGVWDEVSWKADS